MKVVSLFSGAGGLDHGFIKAGHQVIWANDNYKDAVKTYRENIGDHIILDDIRNIDSSNIPDHDILIGGFPCQGFSVANTSRSEKDSRNTLYLEFVRILKDKNPDFFVAENVKGILSLGKGEVFKMIINDFEQVGYKVEYKVLNAADYGVPQKRERVILIGQKTSIEGNVSHPPQTHTKDIDLFKNLMPWLTVGKALQNLPDPDGEHSLKNHTYSKFKLKFNGYIGNRRIDPDKPSPTVTARGDSKGGVVVLHHPSNTRRMSVREIATVQSFPLDYFFHGSNSSAYRQIGNAVPPRLAYSIGLIFKNYYDKMKHENSKKAVYEL